MDDKLKKLQDLLKLLSEGLSREEFVAAFKKVIEQVNKLETELSRKIDTKLEAVRGKDGAPGAKGDRGERGPIGKTFIALRGEKGDKGDKGDSITGPPGKDAEVTALTERLEELDKQLSRRIDSASQGAAARSNNSTKFYPLTADGNTKIFSVPKSVAAILHCSDFPNILYEGSGFSINKTRTQITITTDNAPSNGAQLLYQFSSYFNT